MLDIQNDISLARYTTLKVGGPARYFAEPKSESEVIEALQWARARAIRVFVLGGGSNLLVSDAGFDGLVLHMSIGGIEATQAGEARVYSAGAGVDWDLLVERVVREGCAGLECLSGIPGTVGGTPVQNVGAYGQDVAETIVRVCAVDTQQLQFVEFTNAECEFSYRQRRFNGRDLGLYIISRVEFALRPGGAPKIEYADLKRRFKEKLASGLVPSLVETRDAVLEIRRAKGMVLDDSDADSCSAGSFFKNPVVSVAEYERIAAGSEVAVPHFEAGGGQVKLAAAWLIEQAGLHKGFALGPVAISGKHTLALTNRGGAKAADVLRLKELVQRKVLERFGVELLPEPVMLGFESREAGTSV